MKARRGVLVLKDVHDQIDRVTADAHGWRHDLTDEQGAGSLIKGPLLTLSGG